LPGGEKIGAEHGGNRREHGEKREGGCDNSPPIRILKVESPEAKQPPFESGRALEGYEIALRDRVPALVDLPSDMGFILAAGDETRRRSDDAYRLFFIFIPGP
jgi:hypothetical protein